MLIIRRIIEGTEAKNLEVILLFVNFSEAFYSIHRGNMEQILLAYGFHEKNCNRYNDALQNYERYSSFTGWIHRLLQDCRWTLARRYICVVFIDTQPKIHTSNVHRSNKRKWFHIKKARSRRYSAETMTDALFVKSPAQIKQLGTLTSLRTQIK